MRVRDLVLQTKKTRITSFARKKSMMAMIYMKIKKGCQPTRDITLLFAPSDLPSFKEIPMSQILIVIFRSISIQVLFKNNSKSLITFLIIFWTSHSECLWEHLYNRTQQEIQMVFSVCHIRICMEINSLLVKLKRSHNTIKIDISFLKKITITI
jgi:hypothetical protein